MALLNPVFCGANLNGTLAGFRHEHTNGAAILIARSIVVFKEHQQFYPNLKCVRRVEVSLGNDFFGLASTPITRISWRNYQPFVLISTRMSRSVHISSFWRVVGAESYLTALLNTDCQRFAKVIKVKIPMDFLAERYGGELYIGFPNVGTLILNEVVPGILQLNPKSSERKEGCNPKESCQPYDPPIWIMKLVGWVMIVVCIPLMASSSWCLVVGGRGSHYRGFYVVLGVSVGIFVFFAVGHALRLTLS